MLLTDLFEGDHPAADALSRWFAGSKIVDASGAPLKLYHGTSKDMDFKHFNMPKNGVWFTTSPKDASDYAEQNDSQKSEWDSWERTFVRKHTASRVIPVFVRATNPIHYDAWPDEIRLANSYKRAQGILFDRLRHEGYDAVTFGNPINTVVVIGSPNQIKSAIGNKTFNSSKKGIHESTRSHGYRYIGNCTNLHPPYLAAMMDSATEISYSALAKAVGVENLADQFRGYDWKKKRTDLRMREDYANSYHRATYHGYPCYYVRHSGIEYVFVSSDYDEDRANTPRASARNFMITQAGNLVTNNQPQIVFHVKLVGDRAEIVASSRPSVQAGEALEKFVREHPVITTIDDHGDEKTVDEFIADLRDWVKSANQSEG